MKRVVVKIKILIMITFSNVLFANTNTYTEFIDKYNTSSRLVCNNGILKNEYVKQEKEMIFERSIKINGLSVKCSISDGNFLIPQYGIIIKKDGYGQ